MNNSWLQNLVSENPSITEIIVIFGSIAALLALGVIVVTYGFWRLFKRGQ